MGGVIVLDGFVHSIETLGGSDGPGLRMVVFLQGCDLRCAYCHNPDTWVKGWTEKVASEKIGSEKVASEKIGSKKLSSTEIVEKAKRYRTYFGENGGVTLSGGEPLLQLDFAIDLFRSLKENGIGTALDTAGVLLTDKGKISEVLKYTDVVLLDIKMPDEERYKEYIGGELKTTIDFLKFAGSLSCRIWIRYVVVPGLNDKVEDIDELCKIIREARVLVEKIELLPYHRMGVAKYKSLGIPYRLEYTANADNEFVNYLQQKIQSDLSGYFTQKPDCNQSLI